MDPNDLRQQKARIIAQAEAIQDELASEECDLTDEQRDKREAKMDDLIAQADRLEAQAKEIEQREAQSRQRAERLGRLKGSRNSAGRSAVEDGDGEIPDVRVHEPGFVSDPMKGFASPRDFLSQVAEFSVRGGEMSENLAFLSRAATAGTDEQSGGTNPYGGFLVPVGMSPDMLNVPAETNPFAGRLTSVPMQNPKVDFVARVDKDHSTSVSGGVTVGRKAETAAATASRMEMEKITLTANGLFGLAYATEEILEDSPVSFAAMLAAGFADEFQSNYIREILRGTGVGEPEGIENSPALVSVAKETGQKADTIVYANIKNMRSRCWGYQNAIWLYNHDCLPQLMSLTENVGTGGVPVWQASARDGEPDRLLGRPAIATEFSQKLGDANDIMCVNPTQILYGLYQPLRSGESIHVRFVNHERAFKFYLRDDARGWWRSALTPATSTSTLSPFVGLAARA